MPFLHSVKISITPLSPIHIGCGEDYEPTNCLIKNGTLYGFDPSSVKLSEQEFSQLNQVSESGKISEFVNFCSKNADAFIRCSRSICACCSEAEKIYDKIASKNPIKDDFKNPIERTAYVRRPEGDIPYIPGSSIKGAFTTALFKHFKPKSLKGGSVNSLASAVFDIDTHRLHYRLKGATVPNLTPMRFLKFGDCMPNVEASGLTEVLKAKNVDKIIVGDGSGPFSITENLTFCTYRPFRGFITQQTMPKIISQTVKNSDFDIGYVVGIVDDIYRKLFDAERAYWENWKEVGSWADSVETLLEQLKEIEGGNFCLIRLGQKQGSNSICLENPDDKTVWKCHAHGQDLPFGWALLEIDPQGDNAALKNWVQSQHDKYTEFLKKRNSEQTKTEEDEKEAARRAWLDSLPRIKN